MANILKNLQSYEVHNDLAIFFYKDCDVCVEFDKFTETDTNYTPTPDWGGFNTNTAEVELQVKKVTLTTNKGNECVLNSPKIIKEFSEIIAEEIKSTLEIA